MAQKRGKTKKIVTVKLDDLTGGMNIAKSPEFIKDNEVVRLENMEFDVVGSKLRTRRGLSTPLASFNSTVTHVYNDYEMNDFFVFLKNKEVYRYEFGKQPVLIGKINGDAERPSCCKWKGSLLIASGSKLQEYNYQTLKTIDGSPNCDIVFTRSSRVVVAKTGSDLLIYSAIGDVNSWNENSNDASARKDVNVGYGDGGDIIAIAELASDVLVFKSNGYIYDVQNEPEEWSITLLANNSDVVSRHACDNINSDIVFVSTRGLKSVKSSQVYANFNVMDIGDNINPELKNNVTKPFISDLRRTKQMVVSGACGREMFVYHYWTGGYTKWIFPYNVTSICENQYHVLVAMNTDDTHGAIYEFDFKYTTDNGYSIHQLIQSKEMRDTHNLNAYRTYIDIQSEENDGRGYIYINDVQITHKWTTKELQGEFKTQILSPILRFRFETDDPIIFKYISFDIVLERESMVSDSSAARGRRKSTRSRKGRDQNDFLKGAHKNGGSPYS